MRNLRVLAAVLDAIEERLCEPIRLDDLAAACYCSASGLQKLFRYVFHSSVSEYTAKRRLSRASAELVSTDKSVTEIALDYQYGSPEAFSRAFKRFWGIPPSVFRRERRFTNLFPKFKLIEENGGYVMPDNFRRRVDITDLYDELKKLRDTYVLGVDVCGLMKVNDTLGHAAGDLIIAEAAARIEKEIPPDMLMFRVGGDEFAVVTGYTDEAEVRALWERIARHNGEAVDFEGTEIPVSTRFGICKVPGGNLKYGELHTEISKSLER